MNCSDPAINPCPDSAAVSSVVLFIYVPPCAALNALCWCINACVLPWGVRSCGLILSPAGTYHLPGDRQDVMSQVKLFQPLE